MQKLKEVEKAAEDWDRAKRLRDFAAALRGTGAAEENADLIDFILRAAVWVDPLVNGSMPEVDGVAPCRVINSIAFPQFCGRFCGVTSS